MVFVTKLANRSNSFKMFFGILNVVYNVLLHGKVTQRVQTFMIRSDYYCYSIPYLLSLQNHNMKVKVLACYRNDRKSKILTVLCNWKRITTEVSFWFRETFNIIIANINLIQRISFLTLPMQFPTRCYCTEDDKKTSRGIKPCFNHIFVSQFQCT